MKIKQRNAPHNNSLTTTTTTPKNQTKQPLRTRPNLTTPVCQKIAANWQQNHLPTSTIPLTTAKQQQLLYYTTLFDNSVYAEF
jgi:hypothetical protein